jgi:hypothetical protein
MRKYKFLFVFSLSILGFVFANAADIVPCKEPVKPCIDPVKKSIINGEINHATSKKPIKQVSVTAMLDSKKEKVASTDNRGFYNFDDLKPGIYTFIFQKTGYKKVTKENVMVKVDETFMLDIEMIEDEYGNIPTPFHFINE